MHEGHQGGCRCGALRYRLAAPLPPAYACHCRECKRQTGSALSVSIVVPYASLDLSGAAATIATTAFSGATKSGTFCAACGTRLWNRSTAAPDIVSLKVGTLDDAVTVPIVAHIWVQHLQPGLLLPASAEQYQTQPADMAAWRRALGAAVQQDQPA